MNFVLFIIYTLMVLIKVAKADDNCNKDWDAYEDKKCFKVLTKTMATYDDALVNCKQLDNSATMPIIHSQSEQDFISDLLFTKHQIVDAVWIAARVDNKVVTWADGSKNDYANWAPDRPTNKSAECVEMSPDTPNVGKWLDEPCTKMNLVVCQKMQNWSLDQIEKLLIEYKKEIDNLKASAIPIGFIYVQLPKQPEPHTLWPNNEWQNVTPDYAGLFFRAEGGSSNKFEEGTQSANSPRLIGVNNKNYDVTPYFTLGKQPVTPGSWSQFIFSGKDDRPSVGLSFLVSDAETMPINQSIRIWKKVK